MQSALFFIKSTSDQSSRLFLWICLNDLNPTQAIITYATHLKKGIDSEWLYSLARDEEINVFIRDRKQGHQTSFKYDRLKLNQTEESRLYIYSSEEGKIMI